MFRATLRSLLSRKLRLVMSGLAVVLGVMFVSGAFVLTDTLSRSFDALFSSAYSSTDVAVSGKPKIATGELDENAVPANLPASVVAQIGSVPGVASAVGDVGANGARVIGKNGKVVTSFGPPRLGTNWTGESELVRLREGHGPRAAGEIAVNASLATAAGIKVGDQVSVLTLQPKKTFTLVGIFGYSGDRDSLGGSTVVAFTDPVAQELMLGEKGVYSGVTVDAADGVTPDVLRERVQAALGEQYVVKTGEQLSDDAAADFEQALSFFNNILLGFAGVALFVGVFLILNTFSIIIAQRTKELALMRALGSNRRQVIGSVLLEAVVIGVVASVVGLGAGIGVGALLAMLFSSSGGGGLELAGVGVPAAAVISSFVVGILVTVVAAVLPALRASRIPPVAAMAEVATPDRPLTRITVFGGVVAAAGGALLAVGLSGAGDATLWMILSGVLISFVGVALLTPVISRPVVGLLGRLFSWSVPGRLGRLNSGRNPRRTAITAAALMVGIALITGVNVVLQSATRSLDKVATDSVRAQLFIGGEQASELPPTFDPAVIDEVAKLPGVRSAVGDYLDRAVVNGEQQYLFATTDAVAAADTFSVKVTAGAIAPLGPDQMIIDTATAAKYHLTVGQAATVQLSRGDPHRFTVVAITEELAVFPPMLLPATAAKDFAVPQLIAGYIQLQPGTQPAQVQPAIDRLLADSPEVSVVDRSGFLKQQTSGVDQVLMMIEILLALAILIAVLGVINTLALSVIERTREFGLLRAIGLGRGQTARMVTVESVVISVFGALLGLGVGAGLGAAVVRALESEGITELVFPWSQMATYLALGAIIGVIAALLPALRAARLNVLNAIAHE